MVDALEGMTTLTNDASRWGPWAGTAVTGGEISGMLYFVYPTGGFASYPTTNIFPGGILPEDFLVIPPNQDLYFTDATGLVVKLSKSSFADHVGDLLVEQETGSGAGFFILHWDGNNFDATVFKYPFGSDLLEQAVFAPIDIPALP